MDIYSFYNKPYHTKVYNRGDRKMKQTLRILALLLTLALTVSLCACAGSDDPRAAMAGKYTFYSLDMDGYYVDVPQMTGYYTVLNSDGTGELYWGEENKGPISEWTADGEKLVIKAGVSVMDATLKDGVLTINLSEEANTSLYTLYVSDSADTSSMPMITAEEYAAKMGYTATEAEDVTGVYTDFGAKVDQYGDYILGTDGLANTSITLNEDGTGRYVDDGDEYEIDSWSVDGTALTLTLEGETLTGEIENGIIILYYDTMTGYYAKPDADISGYDLLSQEEYQKITSSAN